MSSLRNKIIASYSLTTIAILIAVVTVYVDLNYLQTQIEEGQSVHELLGATRKLHFERNKQLVDRGPDVYTQLKRQVDHTQETLANAKLYLLEVVDTSEISELDRLIIHYQKIVDDLHGLSGNDSSNQQIQLNATGEELIRLTQDYSDRYRDMLSTTTSLASKMLVIALVFVSLLGIISALLIARWVIRPITELERQLDAVADGHEKKLSLSSDDIEIQSFVQHFNTMLDRLRSQQSKLRHHEKAAALGVLVSGVAHELNNPLSNISTSVQLLLEDDGDTRKDLQQQWLAHVDSESERARRIVKRLLDSVRQTKPNLKPYSAAGIVRSAVLLIHRQLDPSILLHIEDIPETCIKADRERLQQVFINLIRNAVDAGANNVWVFADHITWAESRPEDIERVQGDVSSVSDADALLMFTVSDDGPGIPEDHLAQLFTPFFTTKYGGEGTGLGLYLVEEIIDEHSGCITVENRSEGGTQFMIWMPVSKEECES